MTILAFDSAGAACSVALWRRGITLAHRTIVQRHGHAEILLPMVQASLADAGLAYSDLAAIATTLGPGSFTGLRAGLAAARGLALATGLPTIGVTTLEAAAHQTTAAERRGRNVLIAIDTRRDDMFVQTFDASLTPITPARLAVAATIAAIAPSGAVVLCGDATSMIADRLTASGRDVIVSQGAGAIDARVVAAIAADRVDSGAGTEPLQPVYLRAPDTTAPKDRNA